MMIKRRELQTRARKRHQALRRKQRDPRFRNVMGRFVEEGLLETEVDEITPRRQAVPLDDALWAPAREAPRGSSCTLRHRGDSNRARVLGRVDEATRRGLKLQRDRR
jgi:hypothetical protein